MTKRRKYGHVVAAAFYNEATLRTTSPTQALADHLGIAKSQARDLVHTLREKGLVPATSQGRVTHPASGFHCAFCGVDEGPYFHVQTFDPDGRELRDPIIVCSVRCLRKIKGFTE